jgi:hypothetical protein
LKIAGRFPSHQLSYISAETDLGNLACLNPQIFKMSLTEAEPPKVSTITLQNGQKFDVKSDAGKKLDSLPVIDVSGIYGEDFEKRKAVAEQIRAAAHEIGFFYAINHVS